MNKNAHWRGLKLSPITARVYEYVLIKEPHADSPTAIWWCQMVPKYLFCCSLKLTLLFLTCLNCCFRNSSLKQAGAINDLWRCVCGRGSGRGGGAGQEIFLWLMIGLFKVCDLELVSITIFITLHIWRYIWLLTVFFYMSFHEGIKRTTINNDILLQWFTVHKLFERLRALATKKTVK